MMPGFWVEHAYGPGQAVLRVLACSATFSGIMPIESEFEIGMVALKVL